MKWIFPSAYWKHCQHLLVCLVFLSSTVVAQDAPCTTNAIPVSVTDSEGGFAANLTAADFVAHTHQRLATILTIDLDKGPRRVVLLLDTSASMTRPDTRMWVKTLLIAKDLVDRLPPEDSIALDVFSRRIDQTIDFAKDRAPVLKRLDDMRAQGGVRTEENRRTALWDSTLQALKLFGPTRMGDVIYAITDGDDNQSHATRGQVENTLRASGVRFFALHDFFQASQMQIQPEDLGGSLEKVAKATGGQVVRPYSVSAGGRIMLFEPAHLRVALDRMYVSMAQFYRVEIKLPEPLDGAQDLGLEVMDRKRGGKFDLEYPRRFVPCELKDSGR